MKPGSMIVPVFFRWLALALTVLIQPALAQNKQPQGGGGSPSLQSPAIQQARPTVEAPALPGVTDDGATKTHETVRAALGDSAYDEAQGRLVDQAIPVEDLVVLILERMADDAVADLEDMLDEMARSRDERAALRAKRHQERLDALELDRRRQRALEEKRNAARQAERDARNAARHAAREARENERDRLREARAAERHKRWVAREKARMEREARHEQRQSAREEAREARREAREQRRRKSHLAASLVSAVVDQFNAEGGPQPARVVSILEQIDSQVGSLTVPPPGSGSDKKNDKDAETLDRQLKSLQAIWAEFVAATGASSSGSVRCTKCD